MPPEEVPHLRQDHWSGCGQHIDQVKARVPAEQWCAGHTADANGGWLSRILGR